MGKGTSSLEGVVMGQLNFYRGKRVFVTGHTGFKGTWLCRILTEAGADVTGYALPAPTRPSLFEAACTVRGLPARHPSIGTRSRAARTDAMIFLILFVLVANLVHHLSE